MTSMMSPVHCPYCNGTHVAGMGMVIFHKAALVQYRCVRCGERFFQPDKRTGEVATLRAKGFNIR